MEFEDGQQVYAVVDGVHCPTDTGTIGKEWGIVTWHNDTQVNDVYSDGTTDCPGLEVVACS